MPRLKAVNSAGFIAPAALTADPVILAPLSGRLHVLLVRREEPPQRGRWALPGGFMNDDELPEQTAQRKLTEKTGVGGVYLEQLHTYGDPILIREVNRERLQENCLRCHATFLEDVRAITAHDGRGDVNCLRCHAGVGHGARR